LNLVLLGLHRLSKLLKIKTTTIKQKSDQRLFPLISVLLTLDSTLVEEVAELKGAVAGRQILREPLQEKQIKCSVCV